MSAVKDLETKLDETLNKKAPQLTPGVKDALYRWSPWIALIVGIASLLSALSLWSTARGVHDSAYVIKQLCSTYAGGNSSCDIPSLNHLNFWVWVSIISLVVQGAFYLRAYPRLKLHQKAGWDFLYYAALTSVAYAIITLFTSYDVVGHFIGAAIGAAVNFYILFQIRPLFLGNPSVSAPLIIEAPKPPVASEHTLEPAPQVIEPAPVAAAPVTAPKTTKKKAAPKKKPTAKKKPTVKKTSAKKKS